MKIFTVRIITDDVITSQMESAIMIDMIGLGQEFQKGQVQIQDPSGTLRDLCTQFGFLYTMEVNEEPDLQLVYTVDELYDKELVVYHVETIERNLGMTSVRTQLHEPQTFKLIPDFNSTPLPVQEPLYQRVPRSMRNAPPGIDPMTLMIFGASQIKVGDPITVYDIPTTKSFDRKVVRVLPRNDFSAFEPERETVEFDFPVTVNGKKYTFATRANSKARWFLKSGR